MAKIKKDIIIKTKTKSEKILSTQNVGNDPKAYGTGKRKNAIARVWLKSGTGKIIINYKPIEAYFCRAAYQHTILRPFVVTKTIGQYDIFCTVKGGGTSGQAGAILHGVARALDKIAPEFHEPLHKNSLLTRDSRIVERKKYGKHKARKSTQFSKR